MTREEKQKAIDALKISAPVIGVTQEEFNDYIQQLNKIMDWLEQEPKTGRWLEKEVITDKVIEEWQSARCSKCNLYHTTPFSYYFDNYNFCPNCGSYNGGEE